MPGVLVDDTPSDPYLVLPSSPHSSPSHLSPLPHYIPMLTRSNIPDFFNVDESTPSQLSPLRPPAGLSLNVNSLSDMYAEDGNSLETSLLMQLSPASAGQWGCNSASPMTISALSALQQFLPSNFEDDEGGNASQTDVLSCDEFRMYEFKVKRCMRGRSHDWTECPYVHPGEKARRRDPRRFHYSGTACADFRKGSCKKGDVCEYAHGVFECWLHPARYRTQPCKEGRGCRRRICFFAHTPDQLRFVSSMSSPSTLSSPTSLHFFPTEAFEVGGSSPLYSPAKKASSESCKSRLTSSPLFRMTMEAPSDGCFTSNFSLTPQAMLSPSASSSPSSPNAHINWSQRGVSTFALPAPAMPHLHPSLHSQHSLSAQRGEWERLNQALSPPVPQSQSRSKSAMPLPTSATSYAETSTMQRVEDLMGLLMQADLTEKGTNWRAGGSQSMSMFDGNPTMFDGNSTQWQRGHRVPETGCSRASEEEMLIERFCNDEEEGEPKLERVESGKGLRAQIFQSLLRSASQPSCRIYQDSNLEPLRSSSSLGF